MQMFFYAGCSCVFLFDGISTNSEQCGLFWLGVVAVLFFTMMVDILPFYETKISQQTGNKQFRKLIVAILRLAWYVLSVMVMLLVMTYNYAVVAAVIVAKSVVYVIWGLKHEKVFYRQCYAPTESSMVY